MGIIDANNTRDGDMRYGIYVELGEVYNSDTWVTIAQVALIIFMVLAVMNIIKMGWACKKCYAKFMNE